MKQIAICFSRTIERKNFLNLKNSHTFPKVNSFFDKAKVTRYASFGESTRREIEFRKSRRPHYEPVISYREKPQFDKSYRSTFYSNTP
ncbi:hypothetical protein [Leptospira santarosai]|uniref:Uncharacterized protein n=1 Tax=Leptospira santarosai str. CBC1416 TaxID=1193059 RepID=M6WDG5_9LEPT|nr:hypothetical protein [Leptospira santarosai]EMO59823.1 hypothetical protein LEP1GSC161_3385 [Leptospira santarosai str. CBC1416]EMO14146.1 hypothetical protein LEP1GSC165_2205 [Leptospira santarosai str. CBC523]EMO32797.1 hypothetical protein LEP1GSC175_1518 [Leptospira santarosai str. HAI821]MDI7189827.1 hypothetical protein [Leptospira santarosai]MDI7210508.1 hypothetical protein [Leptospira santarosai]